MMQYDFHGKFLCDVMLARLGRWLRAAGYDTVIAKTGQADRDLFRLAVDEQRLLISLDRKLPEHRASNGHLLLLKSNKIIESIHELNEHLNIDWLFRPFSRCLLCNAMLVQCRPELHPKLYDDVRDTNGDVYYCNNCDQVFWRGSHVSRMRQKLESWNKC